MAMANLFAKTIIFATMSITIYRCRYMTDLATGISVSSRNIVLISYVLTTCCTTVAIIGSCHAPGTKLTLHGKKARRRRSFAAFLRAVSGVRAVATRGIVCLFLILLRRQDGDDDRVPIGNRRYAFRQRNVLDCK